MTINYNNIIKDFLNLKFVLLIPLVFLSVSITGYLAPSFFQNILGYNKINIKIFSAVMISITSITSSGIFQFYLTRNYKILKHMFFSSILTTFMFYNVLINNNTMVLGMILTGLVLNIGFGLFYYYNKFIREMFIN